MHEGRSTRGGAAAASRREVAPPPCPRTTLVFVKTERRNGPRLRLAFSVLVDGPFGIRRCVGRDISPGGLFVETADPYAPGTVVRVTFAVPDGSWEKEWVKLSPQSGSSAPWQWSASSGSTS